MYKSLSLIPFFSGILMTGVAFASPTEVNLSIKRQQSENYEQFVQRAETLAKNTVQQRFQNNQALEEVRVLVVGENQGAIAPVLTVQVNRDNWNHDPRIERWQNTFPHSKDLLGFEQQSAQIQPPTGTTPSIPTGIPTTGTTPSIPTGIPTTVPGTPPETTTTTPKKPDPSQLIPLPYPDRVPSTQPTPPLPNQRLQPNRTP
jgi:hypothetical protein